MNEPTKKLVAELQTYLAEQAEYLAPLPFTNLEEIKTPIEEVNVLIIATKSDDFIQEISSTTPTHVGLIMLQKLLLALHIDLTNIAVHITNHPVAKDHLIYLTEDDLNAIAQVIKTAQPTWVLLLDESLGRLIIHHFIEHTVEMSALKMGDIYNIMGHKCIFTHSMSLLLTQSHHKRATWEHVQPLLNDL